MKRLATKLTPAIKAWIKEEFGSDRYNIHTDGFFHWNKERNIEISCNLYSFIQDGYTEVSESEFLAEFAKPKIDNTERVIQVRTYEHNEWENRVLLMFKNNKAICWTCAKTIEEAKEKNSTFHWNFWRELSIKETITIEKAEELLNFKYKIK